MGIISLTNEKTHLNLMGRCRIQTECASSCSLEMLFTDSALQTSSAEEAYLNRMFNNASFPTSLELRNRYDHAKAAIDDPNADEIRGDYFQLL